MAEKAIVKIVQRRIVSDLEEVLEGRRDYREFADYWKEDAELFFSSWVTFQVLKECHVWVLGERKKMVPPDVLRDNIIKVLDGVQAAISREKEEV